VPAVTRWLIKSGMLYLIAALVLSILMHAGLSARVPLLSVLWPTYLHLSVPGVGVLRQIEPDGSVSAAGLAPITAGPSPRELGDILMSALDRDRLRRRRQAARRRGNDPGQEQRTSHTTSLEPFPGQVCHTQVRWSAICGRAAARFTAAGPTVWLYSIATPPNVSAAPSVHAVSPTMKAATVSSRRIPDISRCVM
jgi:hypothetical protein